MANKQSNFLINSFYISLILVGCFSNNVILELIIIKDKGAGTLMTLFQFAFVALVLSKRNISISDKFKIRLTNKAPLIEHFLMNIMFFFLSVGNNMAFEYGISQPFNVVFRSLSLLFSISIGALFFRKKYHIMKYISVIIVTCGVLITTLAEIQLKSTDEVVEKQETSLFVWLIGVLLLFSTLMGLSILGYLQERVYNKYQVSPNEIMFFSHLLPLPMFLLFSKGLLKHIHIWNQSEPYSILGLEIPSLWILCLLNIITQYICITGVHNVTSRMGSLTCTFVTTIRKFLTMIFSVWYFNNLFTYSHWIGAILVFIGTYLYSTSPNVEKKKEKEM